MTFRNGGVGDTTDILPQMPFYGKFTVRLDCYSDWRSGVKMEVSALGQTKFMGCWNFDCGFGWCACVVGFELEYFNDVPQGSQLSVAVFACSSGQWQNVPLRYIQISSTRYNYYGLRPGTTSQYDRIGFVDFSEQTPPDCPNAAQTCVQGFPEEMPEIIFERKDPSFT